MGVETDSSAKLDKSHFLLNFSPLRPIMKNLVNQTVLVGGSGNILDIVKDCGLNKYIMVDEYCSLKFDGLSPRDIYVRRPLLKKLNSLKDRFSEEELKNLTFKAIFLLHDPTFWEDYFQVIQLWVALPPINTKICYILIGCS